MIQPMPRLQCKRQVLNCPQSARRWAAVVHRTDHSPQWPACYNESPDNQSHGVQGRRHKTSPKMWLMAKWLFCWSLFSSSIEPWAIQTFSPTITLPPLPPFWARRACGQSWHSDSASAAVVPKKVPAGHWRGRMEPKVQKAGAGQAVQSVP